MSKQWYCPQCGPDSNALPSEFTKRMLCVECGAYVDHTCRTPQFVLAMQKRIAELEAAQRWIPVSERLPTEDEMDWLEIAIVRMKDTYISLAHVTDEFGLETWDGDDIGYEWRDVSYWRNSGPLPALPQEAE